MTPDVSHISVKSALAYRIRECKLYNIVEPADMVRGEIAIYMLSDPRDVRTARYVGQTRNPESRFAQHINAARLWLPEERPWWIRSDKLRPLYAWIRELYADDERLPMMCVAGWTSAAMARTEERRFVRAMVAQGQPLLNHEAKIHRKLLAAG